MIFTKHYRIIFTDKDKLFKPQIGFRWKWLSWLPFTSWYYLHIDSRKGFDWSTHHTHYSNDNKLHSDDINIAENNLMMVKNHFDGIDDEQRALKQSLKDYNKTKKHKVKML